MSDGLLMGPPMVPGVDLARDPNIPSKKEQLRVLCLQLATNAVLSTSQHQIADGPKGQPVGQPVSPSEVGKVIVGAAEAMEKYLSK